MKFWDAIALLHILASACLLLAYWLMRRRERKIRERARAVGRHPTSFLPSSSTATFSWTSSCQPSTRTSSRIHVSRDESDYTARVLREPLTTFVDPAPSTREPRSPSDQ